MKRERLAATGRKSDAKAAKERQKIVYNKTSKAAKISHVSFQSALTWPANESRFCAMI